MSSSNSFAELRRRAEPVRRPDVGRLLPTDVLDAKNKEDQGGERGEQASGHIRLLLPGPLVWHAP